MNTNTNTNTNANTLDIQPLRSSLFLASQPTFYQSYYGAEVMAKRNMNMELDTNPSIEIRAYSCPDDDTFLLLPKNDMTSYFMKLYEECHICLEEATEEMELTSILLTKAEFRDLLPYMGKKFDMAHMSFIMQSVQLLRECIALKEKTQSSFATNNAIYQYMMPTISLYAGDTPWKEEKQQILKSMDAVFLRHTTYMEACQDKTMPLNRGQPNANANANVNTNNKNTYDKDFQRSHISDVLNDQLSKHVFQPLKQPSINATNANATNANTGKMWQGISINPGDTVYDLCAMDTVCQSLRNANYQLRADPPVNDNDISQWTTSRSSLAMANKTEEIKAAVSSSNYVAHDSNIFKNEKVYSSAFSAYDNTMELELAKWELQPVYVMVVALHRTELATLVRYEESTNKKLMQAQNMAIRELENNMTMYPCYGFVPLFVLKTTSKEALQSMLESFDKKTFLSMTDLEETLKVKANYLRFLEENEQRQVDTTSKEETTVINTLKMHFKLDDNVEHKYKAQDLFSFFVEFNHQLNLKIDTNFRNRLSKYLTKMGLQKKRFSDGYYYYGLVRREGKELVAWHLESDLARKRGNPFGFQPDSSLDCLAIDSIRDDDLAHRHQWFYGRAKWNGTMESNVAYDIRYKSSTALIGTFSLNEQIGSVLFLNMLGSNSRGGRTYFHKDEIVAYPSTANPTLNLSEEKIKEMVEAEAEAKTNKEANALTNEQIEGQRRADLLSFS